MSPKIARQKPPYLQVADDLRERIELGELKPGDPVPSERELASQWEISRATATKALASLRSRGLVEAVTGVGTRVTDGQRAVTWSPRERYDRMFREGQVRAPGEHSRFSTGVTAGPDCDHVCRALGLDSGSEVIFRDRVTYHNNRPIELATSWFDADLDDEVRKRLLDEEESIPEGTTTYVAKSLGVTPRAAQEVVSAEIASPADAERLELSEPTALLTTSVTIFTNAGNPFTFDVYKQPSPPQTSIYEFDLLQEA